VTFAGAEYRLYMAFLAVTAAVVVLLSAAAYALGLAMGKRGEPARDWVANRWRHRRNQVQPTSRPIEAIAADLHRLGARFHTLDPHASFAKVEAVRGAYDRALAECCAVLGLTHLLGVLPPGLELDAERERVEEQLTDCGVRFPHAA
jgi:hypothetical protein